MSSLRSNPLVSTVRKAQLALDKKLDLEEN